MSRVSLEYRPSGDSRNSYSRKDEEFVADFYLVSKRTLSPDEFKIFSYHYLLGADWRLCCRRLKMDRGMFFHAVYRIEQKLGKTFRELEPYALYPLDEYFGGSTRELDMQATRKPVLSATDPDGETAEEPDAQRKVVPFRGVKRPQPATGGVPLSPPLRKSA